ncbi:hypothetical protein V6C32_10785 [Desulforamulus ruminis]|uniref:hypothetical protein n=1 Tax=Desulforamulus ruminis TaxID=1564 RepID=UPI002FD90CC7
MIPVAAAEDAGTASNDSSGDESSQGDEDDDEDDDSGWISSLISSIQSLIDNIKDLLSGETLRKWFEEWLISLLDSLINPVVNIWSKYMIETPLIGPVGWINKTWNLSLFYALPLFGLATIPIGWRLWRAKDGTGIKQPLLLFGKAAVGCMLTLYFIDFILVIKNQISIAFAQNWLEQAYERLGQDNLPLDAVNGTMLLKAALVDDPANMDAAISLGTAFYNELGLGWVFLTHPLLLIIGLVLLLSWVLLSLLAVSSPVYFAIAVILQKMESIAGWINLAIRTICLPFLFLAAWGICVVSHVSELSTDVGVSPVFVAILVLVAALVASYYVWVKPAYRAVMSPMTLNGGAVIENTGAGLAKMSEYSKQIASRMGFDRLERASHSAGRFGERMKETGSRLKGYGSDIRPDMENPGPLMDRSRILPTGQNKTIGTTSGKSQAVPVYWENKGSIQDGEQSYQTYEVISDHREKLVGTLKNELDPKILENIANNAFTARVTNISQTDFERIVGEVELEAKKLRIPLAIDREKQILSMPAHQAEALDAMKKNINSQFSALRSPVEVKDGKIHVAENLRGKAEAIFEDYFKGKKQYWKVGHEYLTLEKGIPVRNPNPPVDGIYMGEYKGRK